MDRPAWTRRNARPLAGALLLGAGGGALFYLAGLPLPWMLGAMTLTTAAALLGAPIQVPSGLRTGMVLVLGVMLGSGVTPETLRHIGEWAVSLAGLAAYVAVAGGLTALFLRRVGGYDPITAFFSGMPGGLNEMVVVGAAAGGDERTISLIHAVRVLITVIGIVFWFQFAEGYHTGGSTGMKHLWQVPVPDLLILAGCGAVGAVLGRLLRLPAPFMMGPMLVSALVHFTGLTAARPPLEISASAQVVIGSYLGCRFTGVKWELVAITFWRGAASTLVLLATAVLAALGIGAVTGLPWHLVLLAFAPGGLAEMTLVALALNMDVSFVAVHHLARVMLVFCLAPLAYRHLIRHPGK